MLRQLRYHYGEEHDHQVEHEQFARLLEEVVAVDEQVDGEEQDEDAGKEHLSQLHHVQVLLVAIGLPFFLFGHVRLDFQCRQRVYHFALVDDFLVGFHHAHAGCDVVEHFLCGDAVALVVVGEVGVQVIVEIEFREFLAVAAEFLVIEQHVVGTAYGLQVVDAFGYFIFPVEDADAVRHFREAAALVVVAHDALVVE